MCKWNRTSCFHYLVEHSCYLPSALLGVRINKFSREKLVGHIIIEFAELGLHPDPVHLYLTLAVEEETAIYAELLCDE